jgi:predicted Zn-dependent protease with MMP-like domain
MTTRRPITCFILSSLLLSSCAVFAPDPPQRVVRVKALADLSLRERTSLWDQEIRALVEASSDYFEREFGIRFVTQSTGAWPAKERAASTAALLARLKQDFPIDPKKEDYDIVVAFTAERVNTYFGGRGRVDRIGDCRQGLAKYVVIYASAPFRYSGANTEPTLDLVSLIHEFGHLFGAEHTEDTGSIMHKNFDYRSEFDMKNRSVILKNRNCPFAK